MAPVRLACLAALLAGPAVAQVPPSPRAVGLDAAVEAWEARDFAAAERLLRDLALARDPAAMTLLGVMEARGLVSPTDPARAAAWYLKAARLNYRPAMRALARAFRLGEGVPQDLKAAARLEQAAGP